VRLFYFSKIRKKIGIIGTRMGVDWNGCTRVLLKKKKVLPQIHEAGLYNINTIDLRILLCFLG